MSILAVLKGFHRILTIKNFKLEGALENCGEGGGDIPIERRGFGRITGISPKLEQTCCCLRKLEVFVTRPQKKKGTTTFEFTTTTMMCPFPNPN